MRKTKERKGLVLIPMTDPWDWTIYLHLFGEEKCHMTKGKWLCKYSLHAASGIWMSIPFQPTSFCFDFWSGYFTLFIFLELKTSHIFPWVLGFKGRNRCFVVSIQPVGTSGKDFNVIRDMCF